MISKKRGKEEKEDTDLASEAVSRLCMPVERRPFVGDAHVLFILFLPRLAVD